MSVAYLAQSPTLRDFGNDVWWLVLLKVVGVFAMLLLLTLFTINYERKVVARMAQRPGPNQVGPNGWLQSLTDGLKLPFKEEIIPLTADKVVYFLAPVISAVCAFTAFSVIPFGPMVSIFGERTPLQLTDTPVSVLLVLACSGMGIYGVVLAGWASGSTYPLLGGLRSSAQMISYEVAMGLSFVAVFMTAGTMATSEIVGAQEDGARFASLGPIDLYSPSWYAVLLLPSFIIYAISAVGETNRAPFDLPEGEPEIIGYFVEYSGLRWGLFFLAEFMEIVFVSAVLTSIFFGGYQVPFLDPDGFRFGGYVTQIGDAYVSTGGFVLELPHWLVTTLQLGAFGLKVVILCWLQLMIRWTLPRVRADQLMHLGWKVLLPLALAWTMVTALAKLIFLYLGWL